MKEKTKNIIITTYGLIGGLYLVISAMMFFYYEYRYWHTHSVTKSLTIGVLASAGKGIAWPYFQFISDARPELTGAQKMSIKYCALATQYYNEATKILNQSIAKKTNDDNVDIQAINNLKELVEKHGYEVTISKKKKAITDQNIDTKKQYLALKTDALNAAYQVDEVLLNIIIAGWGEKFSGLKQGLELEIEGFERKEESLIQTGQIIQSNWNKWYVEHQKEIEEELSKRISKKED